MKKILSALFVALLVLAFAVTPALAQDGNPTTETEDPVVSTVGDILSAFWGFIEVVINVAALLVVSAGFGERGTEIVKGLLRKISQLPGARWLAVEGYWSAFMALGVAVLLLYNPKFDLQLLQQFSLFQQLDQSLVKVFNLTLLWLTQNYLSNAEVFSGLFKAPSVESLTFRPFPKLPSIKKHVKT